MERFESVQADGHFVNRDTCVLPTFPLSHRLLRVLWHLCWLCLFRFSPTPLFGWRRWLLSLFGAQLHKKARVYPSVKIWAPWNLKMAAYSCFGPGVDVYSMNVVSVGERATVSQRSFLCCGTHDIDSPTFDLITKPITIGREVWIASECFIGPGVTIGDRAVVGARSCVVKNVAESQVVAGAPARVIRMRA